MKRKHWNYLISFFFLFVLSFSMGRAFSDYVVNQTSFDESSQMIQTNKDVVNKNDKVKVTLKYLTIDGKAEYAEFSDLDGSFGSSSNPIFVGRKNTFGNPAEATDATKYNRLMNFLKNKTEFNEFEDSNKTKISENANGYLFNGKENTEEEGFEFQFVVSSEITIRKGWVDTYYNGKYYLLRRSKNIVMSTPTGGDILEIEKNSTLSYSYLSGKCSGIDYSKYTFCGLRTANTDGSYSNTSFDLSTKLASDMTLYAVFNNIKLSTLSNITTTINNAGNKTTIEFYKGNIDKTKNVASDPTYNEYENKFYLGNASTKTTVQSGATIRFNMNNGKETNEFDVDGSNKTFEPENSSHTRQYTVALNNDLYVNGAFCLGGHFGSSANGAFQSQLYNEYVCLDLNGHDIYVSSSGSLYSYGLIKDSIGTGHIYINGGTIYTIASVLDYRGGSFTSEAAGNANVFPFLYYAMPYLRTKVIFNYTSSGWGKLIALCRMTVQTKLDIGDFSHAKFELNFIGTGDGYLFQLKNGTVNKSRIIFDGYSQPAFTSDYCLNRRVGITLDNAELTMASLKFTIASIYKVDTSKYNFPVNCFFDVRLVKSRLFFAQRIQFMAGMSFVADKDSSVVFQYSGDLSGQLSVLDKSVNYYSNGRYISTDNNGESYGQGSQLYNSMDFWKYYSEPKIKIYGKLLFTQGNKTAYKLVGPIDFDETNVGYVTSSGSEVMYSSSSEKDPFTFLKHNNVTIETYGYDFQIHYEQYHSRGFSRPLVSNGKAYAVDSSGVKIGTYSFTDGIFRMDNGDCYYFNNDGTFTIGDTAGNTMKKCTYDESTHLIDDNGTKYIYFASMYGKYDATKKTVDMSRLSSAKTSVAVSYSKDRWLRTS